jgi:hypothetical protein
MATIGPKPLIEEHYHIEELIASQEKRSDERQYHRDKAKSLEERQKLIEDSKMVVATDFHCAFCRGDFKCTVVLQVENDWSNPKQSIAFYKGKHKKCGNWCIRLVTDKQKDGFFIRSRMMMLEQGKYHNDLLQPHETGFNLLYGKPNFTRTN